MDFLWAPSLIKRLKKSDRKWTFCGVSSKNEVMPMSDMNRQSYLKETIVSLHPTRSNHILSFCEAHFLSI